MLKKTLLAVLFVFTTSLLFSYKKPVKDQVLKTIVIDAGHGIKPNGGYDGASGTFAHEDEIALAVSKKLVEMVKRDFPDVKVIETRPTRYITSLRDRSEIANQNKGDLFISIHVNAMPPIEKREQSGTRTEVYYVKQGKKKVKKTRKVPVYRYYTVPNTRAKGTQTYIWGAHKGDDKEVAVRENAPMLAEENYQEKYGPVDVNSPEFVALSLAKTLQFQRRSATLAGMVEDQFAKAGRISGGKMQRQIGIWVLQATAMPSVLVETGFITNPEEELYLTSESGQQTIATCINEAIKNYKSWLEKKQISAGTSGGGTRPNGPAVKSPYEFLQTIDEQERKRQAR